MGDAKVMTSNSHWHDFQPGVSLLKLFFTAVDKSRALSRAVDTLPINSTLIIGYASL